MRRKKRIGDDEEIGMKKDLRVADDGIKKYQIREYGKRIQDSAFSLPDPFESFVWNQDHHHHHLHDLPSHSLSLSDSDGGVTRTMDDSETEKENTRRI